MGFVGKFKDAVEDAKQIRVWSKFKLLELEKNKSLYIKAVGELKNKKNIPYLIKMLKDKEEDTKTRINVTYMLRGMKEKIVFDTLKEIAKDEKEVIRVRSAAIRVLSYFGEAGIDFLVGLLEDNNGQIKIDAAICCGLAKQREAIPVLLDAFELDLLNKRILRKAIDAFLVASKGEELDFERIKELIKDPKYSPLAIAFCDRSEYMQMIVAREIRNKQQDRNERISMIYYLVNTKDSRLISALIEILKDEQEDLGVRKHATNVLCSIGIHAFEDIAEEYLNCEDAITFDYLCEILEEIGEECVPKFLDILGDRYRPAEHRMRAVGILTFLGDEKTAEKMREILKYEEDEDVRELLEEAICIIYGGLEQ